jgi:acylglycerol lipase
MTRHASKELPLAGPQSYNCLVSSQSGVTYVLIIVRKVESILTRIFLQIMTAFLESWLVGPQHTQFYTRTYRPASTAKAVVVFVHGFIEHIARYEHVFPTWSACGIAIFAYDQRGFGRTALDTEKKSKGSSYAKTSWKEQFQDIEWAINHAKSEFGSIPVFLYGHSMV